ncbi:hypothetical protein H7K45_13150 [Mycobacterium yunnanensis]|uniref:Uncharacterized protein n=1 Tax=Mycobacterium yunnanensis TaxID=368477 RepID=A0A9X3BTB6_9MYCO|nr:hypothetical protein [Mycobacterium yunnanensis]MCV7421489.1 hypothetical protein [Mycobacterium yunnanensis]
MFQQLFVNGRECVANQLAGEVAYPGIPAAQSLKAQSEAEVAVAFRVSGARAERFSQVPVVLVVRGSVESPGTPIDLNLR